MNMSILTFLHSLLVLEEDWYHSADPVLSGVTFYVKVRRRPEDKEVCRVLLSLSLSLSLSLFLSLSPSLSVAKALCVMLSMINGFIEMCTYILRF